MANLATLLVNVGVTESGALKVEQKIRGLKKATEDLGTSANKSTCLFSKAFAGLGKQMSGLGSSIKRSLVDSFQGADVAIGGMTLRLGGVPGAAIAAGQALLGLGKSVLDFVEKQTKGADAALETSKQVGLGVEEFQRLEHASKMSGLSSGSLSAGLKKFNANLLAASNGGGKAFTKALADIGLSYQDLAGKSRTEQIGLIGDKLNEVADAGERSALAAQLFGKSAGPEMAQLLAEGTDGLNALTESAVGVFTNEQAEQAAQFHDQLDMVNAQIDAVSRTIAIELLPYVAEVVDAISAWIGENDEFISQAVQDTFREVASTITAVRNDAIMLDEAMRPLNEAMQALGLQSKESGSAISGLGKVVRGLAFPMQAAQERTLLVSRAMRELGLESEEAGEKVEAAMAKVVRAVLRGSKKQSTGMASGKMDKDPNATPEGWAGVGATPADDAQNAMKAQKRLEKERERERKARERGDAKEAKAAAKEAAKLEKEAEQAAKEAARQGSGATADEVVSLLLSGAGKAMALKLKDVASETPRVKDAHPQVAMDIQIWNIENHIQSTDPMGAAKEITGMIRKEMRKANAEAATSLANNVVI